VKADPVVLGMAVFSLTVGLLLYVWMMCAAPDSRSERIHLVCWLLVALFPVLLISSFFPGSEFSAEFKGATMTGAMGAFIFIWWFGSWSGLRAAKLDDLRRQLADRTRDLATLREEAGTERALLRPVPIAVSQEFRYVVNGHPKRRFVLVTGDLRNVKGVDIWVNSENTDMQMSRFHENSSSALIRYHGARRDETTGRVVEDCVANELAARMAGKVSVEPGAAIVTGPGELKGRNGLAALIHLAAVQGAPAQGYRQVERIGDGVRNALLRAEEIARENPAVTSVLFPLLGVGQARAQIGPTARATVSAVLEHARTDLDGRIRTIYLLAYTDAELRVCQQVIADFDQLRPARARGRAAGDG